MTQGHVVEPSEYRGVDHVCASDGQDALGLRVHSPCHVGMCNADGRYLVVGVKMCPPGFDGIGQHVLMGPSPNRPVDVRIRGGYGVRVEERDGQHGHTLVTGSEDPRDWLTLIIGEDVHASMCLAGGTEAQPAGAVVIARDEGHHGSGGKEPLEPFVEQGDGILGGHRSVVDVAGHDDQVDPVLGHLSGQPDQEGALVGFHRLAFEPASDVPVAGMDDLHGRVPLTSTHCQTGVSPSATPREE